uniref:Uncharacterized protein n=1 Tax=Neobodo designis TaxID=312471 RepID=A0A6U4X041_NEODS|mmetsp:Transcript_51586/g.158963  ORF Transcript_51586/g.158963 Transcript_51586/m.158963 type:complete len:261 (+) Transcript_51586:753-1535(+)
MLRQEELSPRGRTVALTRKAHALAVAGRVDDALEILAVLRKTAKDEKQRIAANLTEGPIPVATGDMERGLHLWQLAAEAIAADPENCTFDARGPTTSWYLNGAEIAATCALEGACDSARVSEIVHKGRPFADDDRGYCVRAVSILDRCGRHAEAATMAREVLQESQPAFVAALDAPSVLLCENIHTPADAVPACILLLDALRTNAGFLDAPPGYAIVAAAITATIVLRTDARDEMARRVDRALDELWFSRVFDRRSTAVV